MFSKNNDDLALVFQEPFDCIFDDLLRDCQNNNSEGNNKTDDVAYSDKKVGKKRLRKPAAGKFNKDVNGVSKKVVHREIERQRRQEMASLYASLRSLLPLEYVKGKRSISDHMHQAVSYIKDMQKKIVEMQRRRETLKKSSSIIDRSSSSSSSSPGLGTYKREEIDSTLFTVKVNPCLIGLEILIIMTCNNNNRLNNDEVFPLSKVLVELVRRRLNVVSCTSTRSNERFIHKIEIEADELTCIDPYELQMKLVYVLNLA